MTNAGRTSRKRAKKRARDIGELARLCRCGRGLVAAGRVCELCAAGDTAPRFTDPAAGTAALATPEPAEPDETPQ